MKAVKPHICFWISALIICSLGLFTHSDKQANHAFNVHDTYYVISYFDLAFLFSIILLFIGLIYYLHFKFNIALIRTLSKIHLFGTIGVFIILIFDFLYFKIKAPNPNFPLFDNMSSQIPTYGLCILIFSILQVIFALNSIYSAISYIINKNNS